MKRLVLLALLSLVGCSSGVTEVVVTIDAQSQVAAMTGDVHLVVRGGPASGTGYDAPSALDVNVPVGAGASRTFPLHVTVAPSRGDASRRWALDAMALQTGTSTVIATARVRGSFVEGNTLRIGLVLEDACLNVPCNADQTCRGGACVDSAYVPPGTDAGTPMDAGVDASGGDGAVDAGQPANCPGADVFTADPDAGLLHADGGTPLAYPVVVACPANHTRGAACPATADPTDVCFTERTQVGSAFCRTPCATPDADGGVVLDEARCQAIHTDSHCSFHLGAGVEADDYFCSLPCDPIDDVGCPGGHHCQVIPDLTVGRLVTTCWQLDANPRHQAEACQIQNGTSVPAYNGCAPGYVCSYVDLCGDPAQPGYGCAQLCDTDPTAPVLSCPGGGTCSSYATQGYADLIGGVHFGVCFPP